MAATDQTGSAGVGTCQGLRPFSIPRVPFDVFVSTQQSLRTLSSYFYTSGRSAGEAQTYWPTSHLAVACMTSRWILIDDVDSRINYQGKWEATDGSKFNGEGDWGDVFRNTLHGINEAGSFTFNYDGSSGRVIGSVKFVTAPEGFDPQYECLLDGKKIDTPKPDLTVRNGYELCKWNQETVSDGPHTITVNVKSAGQYFWLDHFMYLPIPGATHDDELIMVESWDTNIHYSAADWENLTPWSRMAKKGGIISFHFYGTGIEWSSLRPKEYPDDQTLVVYSLDGKPSTAVVLNGPGGKTHWNYVVLSVANMSRGFHTLNVQSLGTDKTTPLSLDTLKIWNGNFPESVDTATPITSIPPATTTTGSFTNRVLPTATRTLAVDAAQTSLNSANMGQKNQPPIGPIVGGVLGGLTIILLFVLGLVCIRRRVGTPDDEDSTRVVTPYTALPAIGPYELADHVRSHTSLSSRRTEQTGRSAPSSSQRSAPVVATPTTTEPFISPPNSRNNSRNAGLIRTNTLFLPTAEPPILPSKPDSSSGASRSTTPSSGRRQRSRDADRPSRAGGSSEASSSSSRSRADTNHHRHNSLFVTEPLSALPTKSMMLQASGSRPSRHVKMPSLPPPIEDDVLPPGFGQSSSSSSSSRPPDISKGKLGRVNTLFVPQHESPPPILPEKVMTMSYQHGAMRSQGSGWHGTDRSSPNPPPAHQTTISNELDVSLPQNAIIMHADSGVRIPPQAVPNSPPPMFSPTPPPPPLSPPPPIDAVLNPPLQYPPTLPPDSGR